MFGLHIHPYLKLSDMEMIQTNKFDTSAKSLTEFTFAMVWNALIYLYLVMLLIRVEYCLADIYIEILHNVIHIKTYELREFRNQKIDNILTS